MPPQGAALIDILTLASGGLLSTLQLQKLSNETYLLKCQNSFQQYI